MRTELHGQAVGVHRRAPHSFLLPDRILCDVHHILEREQSVLPPSSRRTRLPEEVPSRRPQTSNGMEKAMKMSLAATAIALTMVVTSAHAGQVPNGYSTNGLALNGVQANGLWTNGLTQNGLWSNGIWQNGVWQNGVWQNGVYQNGLVLNGRTSTGARPDAFAGSQAIGSADLIAIELP